MFVHEKWLYETEYTGETRQRRVSSHVSGTFLIFPFPPVVFPSSHAEAQREMKYGSGLLNPLGPCLWKNEARKHGRKFSSLCPWMRQHRTHTKEGNPNLYPQGRGRERRKSAFLPVTTHLLPYLGRPILKTKEGVVKRSAAKVERRR